RPRRWARAREAQRRRRAHAEPRRARLHALRLRGRQHGAAEARAGAGKAGEGRHPGGTRVGVEPALTNPWIQGGLGPLLAGIAAALVFYPLRVSGLAAAFGFFAAVYLTGQLVFDKKRSRLAAASGLLGGGVDLAFRPTRKAGLVLSLGFGIAACWIFISLIGRMPAERIALLAMGLGGLVAASVAFSV